MRVLTEDHGHIIAIPENANIGIKYIGSCFGTFTGYWEIVVDSDTVLGVFTTEEKALTSISFLFAAMKAGKEFYEM